jgi:hypothetical protein
MNENIKKLKQILDSSQSNKIHVENILSCSTLKDAHIYCKVNSLSGQLSGPALERYIKTVCKMSKNNASSCNGDLNNGNKNFEIKTSNGGKEHNKFNFVQLRISHDCDYILSAYYLNYKNLQQGGELFLFRLNKEEIKPIIIKYGTYAHGTLGKFKKITLEDLNKVDNTKEYALRPKYGDLCWKELLLYRVNEIIV